MAYDIFRWALGAIVFVIVFVVMAKITKNKGKSALTGAFTALILAGVLFLMPVENFFYSFDTIEKAYAYKHHEELITYVECDEGALCIGQKPDGSFICYTMVKSPDGYKLPQGLNEKIKNRSSKFGIFIFKKFEKQSIILTQVRGVCYDGKEFSDNGSGYYYYVVDGNVINSKLTINEERVTLI